jgi:hypothetical protein
MWGVEVDERSPEITDGDGEWELFDDDMVVMGGGGDGGGWGLRLFTLNRGGGEEKEETNGEDISTRPCFLSALAADGDCSSQN